MSLWDLSFEEIVAVTYQRESESGPLLKSMAEVAQRYEGVYALPDVRTGADDPLAVFSPAIIQESIDTPAMRAATVQPNIIVPALNDRLDVERGSRDWANRRRKGYHHVWAESHWPLLARRAFRHLQGYALMALFVRPNFTTGLPQIQVKDPLGVFPDARSPDEIRRPVNVACVYTRSADWLRRTYPASRLEGGGVIPAEGTLGAVTWDCVEWTDAERIVVGILGPTHEQESRAYTWQRATSLGRRSMELFRIVNRAEVVPAVVPYKVSLHRVASQVAGIIGHSDLIARLTALDVRAAEKAIFPDRYIVGDEGRNPRVAGGVWKGGETGETNIVYDARAVGELRGTPDPSGKIASDRVERNARMSVGLVPQMTGEAGQGLRTGRSIDTLGAWAVDPRIQELHEIMAYALGEVNEAINAVWAGYWPQRRYTCFSRWPADTGTFEMVPGRHMAESKLNVVQYAMPGFDLQTATIVLGQLVEAGGISLHTLRVKHPLISDPEGEERRRLEEQIDELGLAALAVRFQQGIPPVDWAELRKAIREGRSLDEAVMAVDEKARERQATEAAQIEGLAAAPGAQPGLGMPGEGGEQMAPQPAMPAGPAGIAQLLEATMAGAGAP